MTTACSAQSDNRRLISGCVTLLKKGAGAKVSTLLQGETGVGKEAFARGVHELSQRKEHAFVAVNCAAIPPELIESELLHGVKKARLQVHINHA